MIDSEVYFTIVYKDLSNEERRALLNNRKFAAGGHSHAFDDRDQLLGALLNVDRTLADLCLEGDHRVQHLLLSVRNLLKAHGRISKANTLSPETEKENKDPSYMVGDISCRLTETEVSILASALELYGEQSEDFKTLAKKIEELYEDYCVKILSFSSPCSIPC